MENLPNYVTWSFLREVIVLFRCSSHLSRLSLSIYVSNRCFSLASCTHTGDHESSVPLMLDDNNSDNDADYDNQQQRIAASSSIRYHIEQCMHPIDLLAWCHFRLCLFSSFDLSSGEFIEFPSFSTKNWHHQAMFTQSSLTGWASLTLFSASTIYINRFTEFVCHIHSNFLFIPTIIVFCSSQIMLIGELCLGWQSSLCSIIEYTVWSELLERKTRSSSLIDRYVKMIPAFCWTWTFVIIFLHTFIQPIISIFTFLKGTLFTGTVCWQTPKTRQDGSIFFAFFKVVVTVLVGLKIQNTIRNDYSAIGDSFLMSTIALGKISLMTMLDESRWILFPGGLMNVMPMMFAKLKQTREEVIIGPLSMIHLFSSHSFLPDHWI